MMITLSRDQDIVENGRVLWYEENNDFPILIAYLGDANDTSDLTELVEMIRDETSTAAKNQWLSQIYEAPSSWIRPTEGTCISVLHATAINCI